MSVPRYKVLAEAAAELRTGPRSLRDWLKLHPHDAQGEPFFGGFGRNKLFTDADIERIRKAYPVPSTSSRRRQVKRRKNQSAAPSSAQLTEVRALIERAARRK